MTRSEVEILLKTVYKGEGAQKALADMDKISASGQKVAGALKMTNQQAATVFSGVSASTRARNPQLFNAGGGAGSGVETPPTVPPNTPPAPSSGGGGKRQPYGGLNQFQYRAAAQFGLGRAAILGGVAGLAGGVAGMMVKEITKVVVKGLTSAFEDARKLYAKSLSSGLGLLFTAKRSALADIIGVSEKDVFQYGAAIGFVNQRLESATAIMARTAPNLTSVAYGFKILKMDLSALFATIGNESAPALRKFADGLSQIIKTITDWYERNSTLINAIASATVQGPVTQLITDAITKAGKDSGAAPNPVSYMQQIHASALEHMGLVVGGIGQGTDFAAQTAHNTKVTATAVTMMSKILSASGGLAKGGNFGILSSSNP